MTCCNCPEAPDWRRLVRSCEFPVILVVKLNAPIAPPVPVKLVTETCQRDGPGTIKLLSGSETVRFPWRSKVPEVGVVTAEPQTVGLAPLPLSLTRVTV